jgi:hypothetical protein
VLSGSDPVSNHPTARNFHVSIIFAEMLKDIPQLSVDNIVVAIVKEPNDEGEMTWNVYLVNLYDQEISNVLVSSKGYGSFEGRDVKTSVLRHLIGNVDAKDYAKIEPIMDNLFGLSNEFWVSFYRGKDIYDKKYIFLPETITEDNFTMIPVLNKKGVMIR